MQKPGTDRQAPESDLRGPAYRILTGRMVIRCWSPSDAPLLKAAINANLEHLRPWLPWAMGEPRDLAMRLQWVRKCRGEFDLGIDYTYGLFDAEEKAVIGGAGLHTRRGANAREIGYWIDQGHTRQGLATEAAAALTKVAFLVDGVQRVEIHCDPANTSSAAVPRRLGFVHEATLRQRMEGSDGSPRDTMVWTMLATELPKSPVSAVEVEAFDAMDRRLL